MMNEKNVPLLSGLSLGVLWIHQKVRGKNPDFLDQVKIKDSNASFMRDIALYITMQFLI